MVPFSRYDWIANVFPAASLVPGTMAEQMFDNMIFQLLAAKVPTTIFFGPRGPIVVTWKNAALM